MVANAAEITVGMEVADKESSTSVGFTIVERNNPASGTGIITEIEMWVKVELENCEIAVFSADGNNLTTHATESLGTVTVGEHSVSNTNPIVVSLPITEGQYIGFYASAGSIEADRVTVADGWWADSGDKIPCTGEGFDEGANKTVMMGGIGATIEEGTTIMFTFEDF